jgi:F-type H+-transporting ATPase subunit b
MRGAHTVNRSDRFEIRKGRMINGKATGEGRRVLTVFVLCLVFGLFALTAAYASGGGEGGHEGSNWFDFVWRALNFLVLAGFLYWLLSKKIKDFFAGRQDGIRTALAEAVTAREEAEKMFREYSEKLDKATDAIDEITQLIQAQGLAEKERIVEAARKASEKTKEDTQGRMEQEFNKAGRELRIEAVRLSAQMAEELIRKNIQADDHDALVKDYIEKVVTK